MDTKALVELAFRHDLKDPGRAEDAFEALRLLEKEGESFLLAHSFNRRLRVVAGQEAVRQGSTRFFDLYNKTLLFDAPVDFDSYLLYMEKDRVAAKRFYQPRRKQLKKVVDAMQDLADRKLELLAVSMPPGTGKSTLALFYLTWLAGKHPDKPILTGSHANSFLNGAYNECLRMMDPQG